MSTNLTQFLKDIADQIRANDGTSQLINPQDFVSKISSTVGQNIPKKSSSDLTSSGATVNVPAGYYSNAASKTLESGEIVNNTTLPSGETSQGTIESGKYIKIGSGYYGQTMYYLSEVASAGLTEVSTLNEMDSLLVAANVGKYYKYIGTTGTSSQGNYYINNSIYTYEV